MFGPAAVDVDFDLSSSNSRVELIDIEIEHIVGLADSPPLQEPSPCFEGGQADQSRGSCHIRLGLVPVGSQPTGPVERPFEGFPLLWIKSLLGLLFCSFGAGTRI